MSRPDYYGNPAGLTEDVETVRAIYDAFARRDIAAMVAHIAPDCELYLRGTAEVAGRSEPYVGHEGVREYFADVEAIWDELLLFADDFRVLPGVVIVLGHVLARRSDASARRFVMWTWRLSGGKATSVRVADAGELREDHESVS
jgi:ketosteroid isomerase-like protein